MKKREFQEFLFRFIPEVRPDEMVDIDSIRMSGNEDGEFNIAYSVIANGHRELYDRYTHSFHWVDLVEEMCD